MRQAGVDSPRWLASRPRPGTGWASLTQAETWPGADWSRAEAPSSAALEAFSAYAFPPRDDVSRQGIRTDALLVIRDGKIIYERYAGPTKASTPHLTW